MGVHSLPEERRLHITPFPKCWGVMLFLDSLEMQNWDIRSLSKWLRVAARKGERQKGSGLLKKRVSELEDQLSGRKGAQGMLRTGK